METRTIELTLDKARKWYNKGGELKEIALQAFSEKELETLTYEEICEGLFTNEIFYCIGLDGTIEELERCEGGFDYMTVNSNAATSSHQLEKLLALNKLVNVARFLNDGWEPNWRNRNENKYCIFYNHYNNIFRIWDYQDVGSSNVYFKSKELALKAIEILGEDVVKLAVGFNW